MKIWHMDGKMSFIRCLKSKGRIIKPFDSTIAIWMFSLHSHPKLHFFIYIDISSFSTDFLLKSSNNGTFRFQIISINFNNTSSLKITHCLQHSPPIHIYFRLPFSIFWLDVQYMWITAVSILDQPWFPHPRGNDADETPTRGWNG